MERRKNLRKAPKQLIDSNVTYQTVNEYPAITGQGTLLDISEDGCRVGGLHTLRKGLRVGKPANRPPFSTIAM